jgi:hypothetical protein
VFRQTDRLSEAIKHTQVYEMVCFIWCYYIFSTVNNFVHPQLIFLTKVTQTKIYQNKLLSLQKEMIDLNERSQKIKVRLL